MLELFVLWFIIMRSVHFVDNDDVEVHFWLSLEVIVLLILSLMLVEFLRGVPSGFVMTLSQT